MAAPDNFARMFTQIAQVREDLRRYDELDAEFGQELAPYMTDDDDIADQHGYDEVVANFATYFTNLLHDLVHDIRQIGEP